MVFDTFLKQYQKTPVEEYANRVSSSPLVSVIVVTYQHINFIRQCLDGILMQEVDFEYEILLGEDDSTDGTREVCMEYAKKYPDKIRLFLHRRENNIKIAGRPTGRFNFLYNLYSARGKYIALCEGDDYWNNDFKLQTQVKYMEKYSNVSLCYGNATSLKEDKKVELGELIQSKRKPIIGIKEIVIRNQCITNTVLFRSNALKIPFGFENAPYGDWALYCSLAMQGKIAYLDEVFSIYRIHEGGIFSHLDEGTQLKNEIITQKFINKFTSYKYTEIIFPVLLNKISNFIRLSVSLDNPEFVKLGRRFLRQEFFALRNWRFIKYYRPRRLFQIYG